MGFARVFRLPRSIPATMTESPTLERLLARAEAVLGRLEGILPLPPAAPDWESAIAFRWRKSNGRGWLQAVRHPHPHLAGPGDGQRALLDAQVAEAVQDGGLHAAAPCVPARRGSGSRSRVAAVPSCT